LSGCVLPISSSCQDTFTHENPNIIPTNKTQDCSDLDAAVYLAAAIYKTVEEEKTKSKTTKVETKNEVKCSNMLGKSQKKCLRQKNDLNDPLDEF